MFVSIDSMQSASCLLFGLRAEYNSMIQTNTWGCRRTHTPHEISNWMGEGGLHPFAMRRLQLLSTPPEQTPAHRDRSASVFRADAVSRPAVTVARSLPSMATAHARPPSRTAAPHTQRAQRDRSDATSPSSIANCRCGYAGKEFGADAAAISFLSVNDGENWRIFWVGFPPVLILRSCCWSVPSRGSDGVHSGTAMLAGPSWAN